MKIKKPTKPRPRAGRRSVAEQRDHAIGAGLNALARGIFSGKPVSESLLDAAANAVATTDARWCDDCSTASLVEHRNILICGECGANLENARRVSAEDVRQVIADVGRKRLRK